MRSSSAFIRFANLFTGYEQYENTTAFNLVSGGAQLDQMSSQNLILDSFVLMQLDFSLTAGVALTLSSVDIRNTGGTAILRYLKTGLIPTVAELDTPLGQARRYSASFWMRCTTPGTFIPTFFGGSVPTGGVIGVGSFRAEIYVFK